MFKNTLKLAFVASALLTSMAYAGSNECGQIKDGTITDSNGNVIHTGFDQWGYNYKARMFNGLYDNFSRPDVPSTEGMVHLQMKWSENWLASEDCDFSGTLDRGGDGNDTGSKGWLTNHEVGSYLDDNGDEQHYTYFVKIVYMDNIQDNCPIDNIIWGAYCITQEIMNDPTGGMTRNSTKAAGINPGLGMYK